MTRTVAVIAALAATGCSAILAATGDPDLRVLEAGTDRKEVERSLGRPASESGNHAVYRVRLGDPPAPGRAAAHAARTGATAGASYGIGRAAWGSGGGEAYVFFILPALLAAEIVATIDELGRRGEPYRLEVTYDGAGKVASYRFLDPPPGPSTPPSDRDLERRWRDAKRRAGR